MKKIIILSFDIPRSKAGFRVKIWRELQDIGATLQMRSFWVLPFNKINLIEFKRICKEIIKNGGKAEVIVGNVICITKETSNTEQRREKSMKELIIESVINVDKSSDLTSREVVSEIKEIFKCKKTGHTGVLDPRVTGVLVVALDNATKIMPVLMGLDKEYEGIMYIHRNIDRKTLEKTISKHFIGEITQVPPVKSRVARKPRKRRVYSFDILKKDGKNIKFRTRVQAGTYIRKLCSDIGEKLGTGAHMKELRRTRVGHFTIKDSHTLEEIKEMSRNEKVLRKILIPIEEAIPHVKRVYVKDSSISSIRNGAPVFTNYLLKIQPRIKSKEMVGIFSQKNKLIALGIAKMNSEEMMKRKKGIVVRTDRVL